LKSSPGWGDGDGYAAYGVGDYADGDQSYGQDEMDHNTTMDEGTRCSKQIKTTKI
jgi:hypothetical protein